MGTSNNIASSDLCVAVCWEYKKKGYKCDSTNYYPSQRKCEMVQGVMTDPSQSLYQPDGVYIIPVNCTAAATPGSPGKPSIAVPGNPGIPTTGSGNTQCGVTYNEPNIVIPVSQTRSSKHRIVGGTEAKANSYPWIVSLQQGTSHFCGGTLIRVSSKYDVSDIIVTASHCVFEGPRNLRAVIGAHSISSSGQAVKAAKYVMHPYYDHKTTVNDIAIIKLEQPVTFSKTIQPACLPPFGQAVPANDYAVVAGWGTMAEGKFSLPDKLLQVSVPVVTDSTCKRYYPEDVDLNLMFCAGYERGGKDSCQGDSGGPLVFKTTTGWTLRGVVSFGDGCARAGKPGVYTRVSHYRNWIDETARRLTSVPLN